MKNGLTSLNEHLTLNSYTLGFSCIILKLRSTHHAHAY